MSKPAPLPPPRQLALPLVAPFATLPRPAPLITLAPRQVWAGLSPPDRARIRQALVALLQEVAHGRDAH